MGLIEARREGKTTDGNDGFTVREVATGKQREIGVRQGETTHDDGITVEVTAGKEEQEDEVR